MQSFSSCLLSVQRLPPPATAFPTPGAGCSFTATPSPGRAGGAGQGVGALVLAWTGVAHLSSRTGGFYPLDRKSTRLNSSHSQISYAVFCLKKKTKRQHTVKTSTLALESVT